MKNFVNFKICLLVLFFSFNYLISKGQKLNDSIYNILSLKEYVFSSNKIKVSALVSIQKHKTLNEPKKKKTLILFIPGSLPIPLIINTPEGLCSPFPFVNYPEYLDNYVFAELPKPGIPNFVDKSKLDQQNRYLNSDGSPLKEYYLNNNLDYFVRINNDFINKFISESKNEINKIIVIGHSQGYHVACKLATINKKITHLICLSSNPYNRFQQFLSEVRFYEYSGQIKSDSANVLTNNIYKDFERLNNNANKNNEFFDGDTYKSWSSFTFFDNSSAFLSLKIPVLIMYGSNDIGSLSNDFLKLDCIRYKKTNITFETLAGLDHGFFENEFNEKGDFIGQKYNWDKILEKCINWSKTR